MGMGELLSLARLADRIGGRYHGDDRPFRGVSTDSRRIEPGELFVALKGPSFDGHDFIAQAEAAGCAAVMVERDVETPLPRIEVADTRVGLGRLAAAWRSQFRLPLIAVTGSNGKTTVKEMLAAILRRQGPVLATQGNLNNDIGVPLTLLRLASEHRTAVVEMGANHPGEIAWLTELARPTVALITNAAAAHLEGFGSLEGVARAKGEIYGGLEEGGIAVINADDPFAGLWRGLNRERKVVTFGLEQEADVSAEWEGGTDGSRLELHTWRGEEHVALPLAGRHNVMNALAATAAALAAGVELSAIREGLEAMTPVAGRLEHKRTAGGIPIIDDSYNANPASLGAALKVLAMAEGVRCLVMGDMGELGEEAVWLHQRIGEMARTEGIDRLYAVGELSRAAVLAFGSGGRHFDDREALIAALRKDLQKGMTVLVKGSRSMRMEQVVNALMDEERGD